MEPGLWGLAVDSRNHLILGGCDLVELAEQFETPLHVVNRDRLLANYRRFLGAFREHYPHVEVFYSYKTNCIPGILAHLHREGCGAEVVSPYEAWLARRLGVDPKRIVYNGVNKMEGDLKSALEAGIGLINIDSVDEAHRLERVAAELERRASVGVRLYPDLGWRAQFGLEPAQDGVVELCRELATGSRCDVRSVHAHIGTGMRRTRDYAVTAKSLCHWAGRIQAATGTSIAGLNLGGGFGVPTVKTLSVGEVAWYKLFNRPPRAPDAKNYPSLDELARSITHVVRESSRHYGLDEPALLLEPGRAITSDAQVLLVTVREIKERSDGRRYAITDGGMQSIAFPLSYEYHHCLLANRKAERIDHRYFVTGPLCSPEDLLYRNWPMPRLAVGDVLALMDAGAYFTSFANNFSFPRPPVAMAADGRVKLLRDRETFDHMTSMDRYRLDEKSLPPAS